MDNKEIAQVLKELAVYKELAGENVFKIRAFENAARIIENYPTPMADLESQNALTQVKGVGKGIAEVITDLVKKGTSRELEEHKLAIPPGLHEMLILEGMGPKRVRAVWQMLGITSIGELEYACRENRLLSLEGFGEKSQAKIRGAIEQHKLYRGRFLFSEALAIATATIKELESTKEFEQVTLAGSLRRGKTIVKDADILVVPRRAGDGQAVLRRLTSLADAAAGGKDIISAGDTKVSIRRSGLQVDFRIIPPESYACALQHFSGSKEHNTLLRSRAKARGYKMNEYGITGADRVMHPASEEEVYKFLDLAWIPPELREGEGEIEAAEKGTLPALVRFAELKGMIHVHSHYSDGILSIGELAGACRERGFSYLCLSDHSRTAVYAHGLTEERLLQQLEEIKGLNADLAPFKIFAGIESDILPDGSLDYPTETLKKLDFVIGAVHSKLNMSKAEATDRLVKAVENPYLTILAHPSGRLLLSREGYAYDEEKILDALAEHGVVLEHNCNPHRLDPDWQTLKKAGLRGILVSLDPDVHDEQGLDHIRYGQIMAGKAWLSAGQILNCKTKEEIDEFFKQRKRKAGAGHL